MIERIPAMLEREMSKLVAQANEIDKNETAPTPKPRKWSRCSASGATASARKVTWVQKIYKMVKCSDCSF